jgi:mRNA interferase MazF
MARGDVLTVRLPSSRGREQAGHRPAVAVQTDTASVQSPTLMIVPFTGQLGAQRFSHTIRVEPSPENGLTSPSILLVFQLRAIDQNRIIRKIGELEQNYLDQLDAEMKRLLDLG